jgi:hypothetical protein
MFTKQRILAFTFMLAFGGTAQAQTLANPDLDYYFGQGIATLIGELGSSSYAKRETAYKTIESFGPTALEQLRRCRGTGNTEAKRRIEELIRRAEDTQIAQQILAPKEVTLKLKGATVQEAIADLASKGGYSMQFQGDATRFAGKSVTLEGKMSYWQALDRLCEQAGLMERIDLRDSFDPYMRGGSPYGSPRSQGPVVLVHRGTARSLVSYAGAVKTEVRISREPKTKELHVVLVISSEPRLHNGMLIGQTLLDKASDELGRPLTVSESAKDLKADAKTAEERERFAHLEKLRQKGLYSPNDMDENMAPYRRVAEVRLRDEHAAKQIKELAGRLTMQVELQNETLARIGKVLDASGKSVDGADGGRLTVQSIKKLPGDKYEVRVSIENLGDNPFKDKFAFNGNGGVAIRGNVIIKGGGMVIGPNGVRINGGGNGKDLPDLLDAKGQKINNAGVLDDNFHVVNNSSSRTARIIYQANTGQGEPSEMALFGTRTYTIAVPFRFENIPLP